MDERYHCDRVGSKTFRGRALDDPRPGQGRRNIDAPIGRIGAPGEG